MKTSNLLTLIIATGMLHTACTSLPKPTPTEQSQGEIAFQKTVKPLFEKRCVWCHQNGKSLGGLNLEDRALTLDPAQRFIVPGDPDESRIFQAISKPSTHPRIMPGDGWGLTHKQEEAIREWIVGGAPWPEGSSGRIQRKPYQVDHDDYR